MAGRAEGKSIRKIAIENKVNEATLGDWLYFWNNGKRRRKEKIIRRTQPQFKSYRYNCINPKSKSELLCILENSRPIPWQAFIKNVDIEDIRKYEKEANIILKEEQWARFYKSVAPKGKEVYYFTHSGIENIFY